MGRQWLPGVLSRRFAEQSGDAGEDLVAVSTHTNRVVGRQIRAQYDRLTSVPLGGDASFRGGGMKKSIIRADRARRGSQERTGGVVSCRPGLSVSRRAALGLIAGGAGVVVLAACGPAAPAVPAAA